jgi:hypothetical protein
MRLIQIVHNGQEFVLDIVLCRECKENAFLICIIISIEKESIKTKDCWGIDGSRVGGGGFWGSDPPPFRHFYFGPNRVKITNLESGTPPLL